MFGISIHSFSFSVVVVYSKTVISGAVPGLRLGVGEEGSRREQEYCIVGV